MTHKQVSYDEPWIKWFDQQSYEDKRKITIAAIKHLMDFDEVRFMEKDDEYVEEYLYWETTGGNLLDE